jgi:tRNA (guanine-N7-)-methyltransferase
MGHKKLIRFEAIKSFPNVLEYPQGMKGKWHVFFGNTNPITLELACGKGEYTAAMAKKYPDKNFIGIDLKGNRIWAGAKKCLEEGLKNAAFLRTQIEKITDYFDENEISEIWITFPDPQLRLSRAKKRLTHPRFLRLYQKILTKNGVVHLKTDSPDLFNFTLLITKLYELTVLENYNDVYAQPGLHDDVKIKTYYESLDIAGCNKVHYIKLNLAKNIPIEKDNHLKQLLSKSSSA